MCAVYQHLNAVPLPITTVQMGISVKMITGDQLLIGKETAKQLGMGTNMFTTEALLKASIRRLCFCCAAGLVAAGVGNTEALLTARVCRLCCLWGLVTLRQRPSVLLAVSHKLR